MVTLANVSGHRDVSLTSCPGDVTYAQLASIRDRVRALAKLAIAAIAVLGVLAWVRFSGPLPWSYDEYYHLALAREMRSGVRLETFPWAPFSVLFERFIRQHAQALARQIPGARFTAFEGGHNDWAGSQQVRITR